MAFLDGATWHSQKAPHGLIWSHHMALSSVPTWPSVVTWLYLVSPHGFLVLPHVFTWFCHMALPDLAMCHHFYNLCTCMYAMCHTHDTSQDNDYAWMTCVLPCVITIIHIHAWLPCVIHMTLFRIRTMHGWHVSYHMSLLRVMSMHGWHVSYHMESHKIMSMQGWHVSHQMSSPRACTCMVAMCPPQGTSRSHNHVWVSCVPAHVTSRDYGYAWVPCVLTNGTSMKSSRACPSPCDDHQWNSHNSFISCPFWTFLSSLESLSRAQLGSDTTARILGSKSSPNLCPK